MSRYRIYQIDQSDPKKVGQNVRRQIRLSVVLLIILFLIFTILLVVHKMTLDFLWVLMIPLLGFYLLYFSKLGSKLENIKVIGEIEFTRTSIRKKIGDSITEYYFHTVKKIELRKHLPRIGFNRTLSDNFTYILKITFPNSSSESMVVSSEPIDTKLNISIVETMKTLKKIIEPEITIET